MNKLEQLKDIAARLEVMRRELKQQKKAARLAART